jgi:hypothetical protein
MFLVREVLYKYAIELLGGKSELRAFVHTVRCLQKGRIVKPAETAVARKRLCKY